MNGMNKGFLGIVFFSAGGALGFIAANALMKGRYERLVQDEVESVKAAFKRERARTDGKPEKPSEKERRDYAKRVSNLGYAKEAKPKPAFGPRVISPDDFGEMEEYDEISLTCYADGTLADDNDRAMGEDEIEETVGRDSLTRFGEYEEDSVFVRNDRLKADYEILRDTRTYAEVLKDKPYLKADPR